MGKTGRFGKYGEQKRIGRIRGFQKSSGFDAHKGCLKEERRIARYERKASRKPRITIRPGVRSDAHYIQTLSRKVFQQYGPYEEILPQWFYARRTVTLIALVGKKPVGFIMLGKPGHRWETPSRCELLGVAVEPESQGMGVGDTLLGEIIKKTHELFIERIVLHTAVLNLPGKNLFKKHGFSPKGVKKGFYPGGQDALMMCKDLFGRRPKRETGL